MTRLFAPWQWMLRQYEFLLGRLVSKQRLRRLFADAEQQAKRDFIRIFITSPLPKNQNLILTNLFSSPNPRLLPIQRNLASHLLSYVEAEYLPRKLVQLLESYDVYQAVNRFLFALNFNYAELIRHTKIRHLFNKIIFVLVELDTIQHNRSPNDLPLYEVIAGHDIAQIEAMVERYRKVNNILLLLPENSTRFFAYQQEFYPRSCLRLEKWWKLSAIEIELIYCEYLRWSKLQNHFDQSLERASALLFWLQNQIRLPARLRSEVQMIIRQLQSLQHGLMHGIVRPTKGLLQLEAIVTRLQELHISVDEEAKQSKDHQGSDKWESNQNAQQGVGYPERHLRILELSTRKEISHRSVKHAYRIMANKHHPDKAGGDAEVFKRVKHSYDVLMQCLDMQNLNN